MAITKLTSEQLYRKCDAAKFDFTTTADLEERLSALGQDRAICAVELGINIKSRGYNLFCLGPEGTGKTSLVKRILEKEGKQRPTPDDWAYVYNFDEPHKPIAVNFPAGAAAGFAKDMEEFAYAMEHNANGILGIRLWFQKSLDSLVMAGIQSDIPDGVSFRMVAPK